MTTEELIRDCDDLATQLYDKEEVSTADVNGALNIMRKAVGKITINPIEACSMPSVITVKFN